MSNTVIANTQAELESQRVIIGSNTPGVNDFAIFSAVGAVQGISAAAATALLAALVGDAGSGGTKGLAPAPSAGDAAAGKFLKASGAWAVPAGGSSAAGSTLLASVTAAASTSLPLTTRNASGQSGAIFQSDFNTYQFEICGLVPATNNLQLVWEFSADGGGTWNTTTNYYTYYTGNTNTGAARTANSNGSASWVIASGLANTSTRPLSAALWLRSPLSTTLDKTMAGHVSYGDQTTVGEVTWGGWLTISGTAFNAVRLRMSDNSAITVGDFLVTGLAK